MTRGELNDLIVRLRAPANWLREDKGSTWKDGVARNDLAPYEAAEAIEALLREKPT